jgi:cytochrome c
MKAILPTMALALVTSFVSAAALAAEPATEGLLKKYACIACHATTTKLVGPAYKDVAVKYAKDKGAAATLAGKVKQGGVGVWGQIPMPPNATVPDADLQAMVKWILAIK